MTMNDKKVRKRRTIKDGIVDIDDIKIEPGDKYSNWIPIVRTKMSQRESILLTKRIQITNELIRESINLFFLPENENENKNNNNNNNNMYKNDKQILINLFTQKFINSERVQDITKTANNLIIKHLNDWKGVQRSKKTAKLFRDYFKISKNWWDQKKIELIAVHFYMPLINLIYEITKIAADKLFDAKYGKTIKEKFCLYLNTLIFKSLSKGMLKMANSRARLLIPAGVYINFFNKQNEILLFKNICDKDKSIGQCVLNAKGGKYTRDIVMKAIENISNQCQIEYENALNHLDINRIVKKEEKEENNDQDQDEEEETTVSSNAETVISSVDAIKTALPINPVVIPRIDDINDIPKPAFVTENVAVHNTGDNIIEPRVINNTFIHHNYIYSHDPHPHSHPFMRPMISPPFVQRSMDNVHYGQYHHIMPPIAMPRNNRYRYSDGIEQPPPPPPSWSNNFDNDQKNIDTSSPTIIENENYNDSSNHMTNYHRDNYINYNYINDNNHVRCDDGSADFCPMFIDDTFDHSQQIESQFDNEGYCFNHNNNNNYNDYDGYHNSNYNGYHSSTYQLDTSRHSPY